MSELNRDEVLGRVENAVAEFGDRPATLVRTIMNIIDEIVDEFEARGEDEDDRSLDEALSGRRSALDCPEDVELVEWFEDTPRDGR